MFKDIICLCQILIWRYLIRLSKFSVMKLSFFFLLAFVYSLSAFCVERADLIVKLKDGSTVKKVFDAVEIEKNTRRISVPKSAIPEGFEWFEIIADNAWAKNGEQGFWIFGRGEMGTFRLNEGAYMNREAQIPIYGMRTPRETFLAVVRGMQMDMKMCVDVKDGIYRIRPRWNFRNMGYAPYEDIIIDFISLFGEDANYSGMGRAYRKMQLESGKFKAFKERMKDNRALRQIATAMPHRIEPHAVITGMRGKKVSDSLDLKPEDVAGKAKPILTFSNAKKFVDAFKAAGMDDVHFIDAGWQCGGYDGRCPQILPIEECLGGESALKEFVKYTKGLGYQICSNSNHTDAYTCSDMWNEDYICKRYDGSLFRVCVLNGGNMYYVCTKRILELFVIKQLEETRKLGYEGVLYIDVFSARPPDQCFDSRHAATRREQADAQNKILEYARKIFGGAASECGYEHCLHNLDFVNYLGRHMLYGEGFGDKNIAKCSYFEDKPKYNSLIDRIAPLWEIVYHGIVLSNPDKFTQGYRPKGSTNFLRLVEFGGRPIFYSAAYSPQAIAKYKEMYDAFQPLKHLQLEFIEENKSLDEGVYITRFGNGEEIVVNYSMKPFKYREKYVPPRDYLLFK